MACFPNWSIVVEVWVSLIIGKCQYSLIILLTSFKLFFKGIRAVAECLAKSNSEETQDCARNLLQQLSSVRHLFLHLFTRYHKILFHKVTVTFSSSKNLSILH